MCPFSSVCHFLIKGIFKASGTIGCDIWQKLACCSHDFMSVSSDLKLLFSPSACHFHFDVSDWVNLKKLSVTTSLPDMNQKHWCVFSFDFLHSGCCTPKRTDQRSDGERPRKTPLPFLVIALKQHGRRGGAKGIKLFGKHTPFEGRFSSLIRKQVENVEVKSGSWNSNQSWQMA